MMWKSVLILLFVKKAFTKSLMKLEEIPAFQKNGTHVKNEEELIWKINRIIDDGYYHMQIVTDFDNTLTADNGVDGKTVINSFAMFRICPSVPQSYKDEDYKLYLKYKPIENDPDMSTNEKSQKLVEWYRAAHKLLKGLKFPRQELKDVAHNAASGFREGINDLFKWVTDKKVAFLVLSSGLGEAVLDTFEAANLTSPQLKVLSNFLEIGSDDIIIGMKGNPIHKLNKNEFYAKETDSNENIKGRSNVILMGDVIEDASMVDGVKNLNTVIKIGYLSKDRRTFLSEYLDNFDIVLENDQTMDVIKNIINIL